MQQRESIWCPHEVWACTGYRLRRAAKRCNRWCGSRMARALLLLLLRPSPSSSLPSSFLHLLSSSALCTKRASLQFLSLSDFFCFFLLSCISRTLFFLCFLYVVLYLLRLSASYFSSLSLVLLLILVPRVLLLRDLLWFFVTSLSSFVSALLCFFPSPSLVLLPSFRSIYCPFLLVPTWPPRFRSLCLLRVWLYVTVPSRASSSTFLYSFIRIYSLHCLFSFARIV